MNRITSVPQIPQVNHQVHSHQDLSIAGAETIDDIMQNSQDFQRRRSLPQQPYSSSLPQQNTDRRMSMLEFGDNSDAFSDYQFGVVNSPGDHMNSGFPTINTNLSIPGTSGNFSPQSMMADDFSNLSPEMMGNMIAFSNMNMGQISADPSALNMFPPPSLAAGFPQTAINPVSSAFTMDLSNDASPVGVSPNTAGTSMVLDNNDPAMLGGAQTFAAGISNQPATGFRLNINPSALPGISAQQQPQMTSQAPAIKSPNYQSPLAAATGSNSDGTLMQPQTLTPMNVPGRPAPLPKEQKTIYSKSGFDMLKALLLVATRKNPQVNLGAVDMSCAFVVCDVTMNDCPIIYVSDNFQNLTGYNSHEIMGQNCRFLQAPDGKVEAGTKREFVDNGAVFNLKQKIAEGKEVQQSLINYRKGGKPFLNLLTMIPIPWDTEEIRYIIGFQIDLVECPDAIGSSNHGSGSITNYKHSDIGQYIFNPPAMSQWEPETGQTLGVDDVSTLLQQFTPKGAVSDWHKQSWDKMLLENADDVVHVLSLKGLFLYLSPSCKRILEYDSTDLVGSSISSICHPSDIVPVTRELKDTTTGSPVNIVFRIRRKESGYTWFESHGSLFIEAGKGRKCIILVGRKRPVFALHRRDIEANGGIGDSELWTKLSTSGLFLFVSSNVRSLLDLQPDHLVGTSIQELMRRESRPEFGRTIEKARRGRIVTCKHEVQNRRGQVLQAHTTLYPGDASEGQKPTFLLAQTKLVKASSRAIAPAASQLAAKQSVAGTVPTDPKFLAASFNMAQGAKASSDGGIISVAGGGLPLGSQDVALASDDNIFDELKTTRCTSWQYELRQMEKVNRVLAEELHGLLSNKKKRKRRKGVGNVIRDCANCHTRNTPEWRRGPSGQRDLCNSCGLRWAKQTGRVSPRNSSRGGNGDTASKKSTSPVHSSPLHREVSAGESSTQPSEAESKLAGGKTINPSVSPNTGPAFPSKPPLSQPLLAGGADGGQMAPIREEREASS
ncbi:PAS domain-containing protein [Xylariales sp. PMI_506]|nr:PAS domain-containing protein [Xylariales sp. PMI_506]